MIHPAQAGFYRPPALHTAINTAPNFIFPRSSFVAKSDIMCRSTIPDVRQRDAPFQLHAAANGCLTRTVRPWWFPQAGEPRLSRDPLAPEREAAGWILRFRVGVQMESQTS